MEENSQGQARPGPDPFKTPGEILPGETNETRLIRIDYLCHLCRVTHQAEYYITVGEKDLPQLVEEISQGLQGGTLHRLLESQEFQNSMNIIAQRMHSLRLGDLEELNLAYEGKAEKPELIITNISLTEETRYTCDHCGRTFESIGLLRLHLGQDPYTLEQYVNLPGGCRGNIE